MEELGESTRSISISRKDNAGGLIEKACIVTWVGIYNESLKAWALGKSLRLRLYFIVYPSSRHNIYSIHALGLVPDSTLEDIWTKGSFTHFINEEAVYRTAPATPGLLIITKPLSGVYLPTPGCHCTPVLYTCTVLHLYCAVLLC